VTRKTLLKGREDMLALVAAQLRAKAEKQDGSAGRKRIWVDVGFPIYLYSHLQQA
jgi:betaine lipid synthase